MVGVANPNLLLHLSPNSPTTEYYSTIKKNKTPFATTWMDLEIIILSEVSQEEKDKYHLVSLIFGI